MALRAEEVEANLQAEDQKREKSKQEIEKAKKQKNQAKKELDDAVAIASKGPSPASTTPTPSSQTKGERYRSDNFGNDDLYSGAQHKVRQVSAGMIVSDGARMTNTSRREGPSTPNLDRPTRLSGDVQRRRTKSIYEKGRFQRQASGSGKVTQSDPERFVDATLRFKRDVEMNPTSFQLEAINSQRTQEEKQQKVLEFVKTQRFEKFYKLSLKWIKQNEKQEKELLEVIAKKNNVIKTASKLAKKDKRLIRLTEIKLNQEKDIANKRGKELLESVQQNKDLSRKVLAFLQERSKLSREIANLSEKDRNMLRQLEQKENELQTERKKQLSPTKRAALYAFLVSFGVVAGAGVAYQIWERGDASRISKILDTFDNRWFEDIDLQPGHPSTWSAREAARVLGKVTARYMKYHKKSVLGKLSTEAGRLYRKWFE